MANGWFDFVNGQTVPASRVQDYLMNQTVMVFADATARSAALYLPTQGMFTFLQDTNSLEYWDSAAWVALGAPPAIPDPLSPLLLIGA